MRRVVVGIFLFFVFGLSGAAFAADDQSIADATAGFDKQEGLMTVYVKAAEGKILLELPAPDDNGISARVIYANFLTGGLGSNPVGLDRSAGGDTEIVAFRRVGGKVLIEAENWRYRATADSFNEKRATRNSFASSVLFSAPILAATGGNLLIDIGPFLVRDAVDVVGRLKNSRQGNFRVASDRSMADPKGVLVFPENLEFDAVMTYESSEPGPEIQATTPSPRAVTLTQHHSFIKLPDAGYKTRNADPRAATIETNYQDYSASLDTPVFKRLARRFRLEKTDPAAARSRVKKPIVYYVDNGAPEPIRSALVEGASWWAKAFEAAGFIDAYRVEILPDDVHPLDARYNVIQWVHRATRGWSYGGAIADPRTGETIKGFVILGSLRVRQDRMIFEGLAGIEKTGTGTADDPVEIALSRIRQLSAHEVGHTLGFAHNMGASTYAGRASVMDYPAPYVGINGDGSLDFSNAYAAGMGVWDMFTVDYLYRQFPQGMDEKGALESLVQKGLSEGLRYVADANSRPIGSAHPYGNLWDNGEEPVEALRHTLRVRDIALSNFGLRNIQPGQRVSDLHTVIVPIYLYHRYQIEAAAKVLGGMNFGYGVKGDGQAAASLLTPGWQRDALAALLESVDPAALDLSDDVLNVLTPAHRGGFGDAKFPTEQFRPKAFPAFDVLEAAGVAADMTFGAVLHPERAARLVEFKRRDGSQPGLAYVLDELDKAVFANARGENERRVEIRRVLQDRLVAAMIDLSLSSNASSGTIARVDAKLAAIGGRLSGARSRSDVVRAHDARLAAVIRRHLERPAEARPAKPAELPSPPGSPIGASDAEDCWHCYP